MPYGLKYYFDTFSAYVDPQGIFTHTLLLCQRYTATMFNPVPKHIQTTHSLHILHTNVQQHENSVLIPCCVKATELLGKGREKMALWVVITWSWCWCLCTEVTRGLSQCWLVVKTVPMLSELSLRYISKGFFWSSLQADPGQSAPGRSEY